MVFWNSVLIKSLCKRAILTNAWILGSIVKLQFDKGEISFWLTVKSLLIDINTLNATKLVQLYSEPHQFYMIEHIFKKSLHFWQSKNIDKLPLANLNDGTHAVIDNFEKQTR